MKKWFKKIWRQFYNWLLPEWEFPADKTRQKGKSYADAEKVLRESHTGSPGNLDPKRCAELKMDCNPELTPGPDPSKPVKIVNAEGKEEWVSFEEWNTMLDEAAFLRVDTHFIPNEPHIYKYDEPLTKEKLEEYLKEIFEDRASDHDKKHSVGHGCNRHGIHFATPANPVCKDCDCKWGEEFDKAMKEELDIFLKDEA